MEILTPMLVVNAAMGYNQGEPGGVISTDTGSNHLLPLEGKHMADADHIGSRDPILVALEDPRRRANLERRMATKVRRGAPDDCWEWLPRASCNGGYGAINSGRTFPKLRAHRVAWALAGGDLPEGSVIRHDCDNPKCCNPSHLLLGTQIDNIADMNKRGRGANPPTHKGERHHFATIPDSAIEGIRADPRPSEMIGPEYGVTGRTIRRIKAGVSR